MSKTIVIAGSGPGISHAIAERFGREGYAVALAARNAAKLDASVAALKASGVRAVGFATDVGQPDAVRGLIGKVREALGPIDVLQWNAYGAGGGDLTKADDGGLRAVLDVAVTGLVAGVQAALPDLRARKGAVLVTNGGLGLFDANVDAMGVTWGAAGLSIANSAKHKAVRLLHKQLAPDVYVGEVMVTEAVKGTPFDQGQAKLEASSVAAAFWDLLQGRQELSRLVGA